MSRPSLCQPSVHSVVRELRLSLRNLLWVAGALLATAVGCAGTDNAPVGTAEVALAVPNEWSLVQLGWVVQAADGTTVATGAGDVTIAQTTISMELVLPEGSDDSLTLEAVTSDGVHCSGTTDPFDVIPGRPSPVNVTLTCQTTSDGPAICATVLVQGPTPPEATAPLGRIAIQATASDPDGTGVISFDWNATAGTFNAAFASSVLYTCSTVGAQTIVLTVTDDQPTSSCSATFLLPVTCLP